MRRRLGRGGPRSAVGRIIQRLQIGGQRPGRAGIAGVVILQEQVQCEAEAALGKTACAAMTGRATIRKQPGRRFARIEVLGARWAADQQRNDAKDEDKGKEKGERTAPQPRDLRHMLLPTLTQEGLWSNNVKMAAARGEPLRHVLRWRPQSNFQT